MKSLSDRMKEYEYSYRNKLPRRLPVIIRIDGKAFHTYTKGMKKPFDEDITSAMWQTASYLCENIMGCKLAYTQSDEISLFITNYDTLTTDAWLDNNIQKMVSISASLATAKFNSVMSVRYPEKDFAIFDARAWILPKEEVNNYFVYRQQDAIKNSIAMLAQNNFKHSELQGLNGIEMKKKLKQEKDLDWDDLPTWKKQGICVTKEAFESENSIRHFWNVDSHIPIFSNSPEYVSKFITPIVEK